MRPQNIAELVQRGVTAEYKELTVEDMDRLLRMTATYPELGAFEQEWTQVREGKELEMAKAQPRIGEYARSSIYSTGDTIIWGDNNTSGSPTGNRIWISRDPALPVLPDPPPPGIYTPGPNRVNLDYPHFKNNRTIADCPFCGSRSRMVVYQDTSNHLWVAVAECETVNCGCKMVHLDRDEKQAETLLLAAWDNRVNPKEKVVPDHIVKEFSFFFGIIQNALEFMELSDGQKENINKRLESIRGWLTRHMIPLDLAKKPEQYPQTKKLAEQIQDLFFNRGREG